MQVKDVMTQNVISVGADEPVVKAARVMLQNRISGLPVVDAKGQLVGVVTEGDFLRRREIGTERQRPKWLEFVLGPGKLAQEYVHASGRRVAEIMTPDPLTIGEERLAGRRRRSHGTPPHQAASGDPGRPHGRHRQPRQSDARAGEPVARGSGSGRRRWRDPRRMYRGIGKAALGAARQCRGQEWRCRTVGRRHRRSGRGRRLIVAAENVAGVDEGARPSGLGRADVRHGVSLRRRRSQRGSPATRRRFLNIAASHERKKDGAAAHAARSCNCASASPALPMSWRY